MKRRKNLILLLTALGTFATSESNGQNVTLTTRDFGLIIELGFENQVELEGLRETNAHWKAQATEASLLIEQERNIHARTASDFESCKENAVRVDGQHKKEIKKELNKGRKQGAAGGILLALLILIAL